MITFIKKHIKLILCLLAWIILAVPLCYWMSVATLIFGSIWAAAWFYYMFLMPLGCLVILITWGEI